MEQENDTQQEQFVDMKLNGGIEKTRYEIDYSGLAILFFLAITVATLVFTLQERTQANQPELPVATIETPTTTAPVDVFADINIEGKAAFVLDVNNNEVLYAKNAELQLPLASITKLMTIAAANQYIDPEATVMIEEANLGEEGDSGLLAFEEWRVRDLMDFTLISSSNDGADALAAAAGVAKQVRENSDAETPQDAFVQEMNELAASIGLSQTYFLNETGLDPTEVTSGGYGSARDAAYLLEYVLSTSPELVEPTTLPQKEIVSQSNFIHTATNTNQNIGNIPGLMASKTGFTDLAGGNLVIAFDAGIDRPIIVAVLGSTLEGRFTDVEALSAAALKALQY